MNKIYNFLLIGMFFFSFSQINAQDIVSIDFVSSFTKAELQAEFGSVSIFIKNGVETFKVIYTTTDLEGESTEVSGLFVVPDNNTKRYPLLCYQHGTSSGPDGVMSVPGNAEAAIARLFGGLGFVTTGPDLLGLGDHVGIHPYVHADSEAWVAADMMRAVRTYAEDNDIHINDQVFLTGYSQGGHSSMALQRYLETDVPDEFAVTAGSHMSGPYDISGVMRDLVLSDEEYFFPAYIPNLMLSYQAAYGTIYTDMSEIIKSEYVSIIQQFKNDEIDLFTLNENLIDMLTQNEGISLPKLLFQEDVIAEVEDNLDHPINVALADNDVYDWAPTAPTRMIYCTHDDQVPFENALTAEEKMIENGSTTAVAVDVDSGNMLDHGGCVTPALTDAFLSGFLPHQMIDDVNSTNNISFDLPFEVFPNPVADYLTIKDLPENGALNILNANGKLVFQKELVFGDNQINLSALPSGFYLMQIVGENQVWQERLIVD